MCANFLRKFAQMDSHKQKNAYKFNLKQHYWHIAIETYGGLKLFENENECKYAQETNT